MALSKEEYLEKYSETFGLIQKTRRKDVIQNTVGSFVDSTNELMRGYLLNNFEYYGITAMVSCVDDKIQRVFPGMKIIAVDPKTCDGKMFMLLVSGPKDSPINAQSTTES